MILDWHYLLPVPVLPVAFTKNMNIIFNKHIHIRCITQTIAFNTRIVHMKLVYNKCILEGSFVGTLYDFDMVTMYFDPRLSVTSADFDPRRHVY